MEKPTMGDFQKQVALVLIGALIALGSGLVTSTTQARLQKSQALQERRLAALREFSVTATEGLSMGLLGTVQAKILLENIKQKLEVGQLPEPGEFQEVVKAQSSGSERRQKLAIEMTTQRVMAYALFNMKAPDLDPEIPDVKNLSLDFGAMARLAQESRKQLSQEERIALLKRAIAMMEGTLNSEQRSLTESLKESHAEALALAKLAID